MELSHRQRQELQAQRSQLEMRHQTLLTRAKHLTETEKDYQRNSELNHTALECLEKEADL